MNTSSRSSIDTTLIESVSQYLGKFGDSFTLVNASVPQFDPEEDVFDFISEFERTTASFNDDQKAKLFLKAFPKKRCLPWFKANVKPAIEKGNDWLKIKPLLISRFSDSGLKERHLRKLKEMSFDLESGQRLLEFIEQYVYSYKKVFKEAEDRDVIDIIKASLPKTVIISLNLIPGFTGIDNLDSLYQAAKQFDVQCSSPNPLNKSQAELNKLIVELKELVSRSKERKKTDTKAFAIQATGSPSSSRGSSPSMSPKVRSRSPVRRTDWQRNNASPSPAPSESRYPIPSHSQARSFYNPYGNFYPMPVPMPYQFPFQTPNLMQNGYQAPMRPPSPAKPVEDVNKKQEPTGVIRAFEDDSYFAHCGRPTRPCSLCNLMHWDKHCPLKLKNLKE